MHLLGTPSMGCALAAERHRASRTRRGDNATEDMVQVILALAQRLFHGHAVTTRYIRERHGVSLATAKRYMLRLERGLPVRVTRTSDGRILSLLERFNRSEGNTSRRARGEQRIQ